MFIKIVIKVIRKTMRKALKLKTILCFVLMFLIWGIIERPSTLDEFVSSSFNRAEQSIELTSDFEIPDYQGEPYAILNENQPGFSKEELSTQSFKSYSDLDSLGRCGVAFACIGQDIMPTKERGKIGMVKPSGWQTVKYNFIEGKYLYNRCHLIGYQLSGENANKKNLITGTRFLNVKGMLPFENEVADYVKSTNNHVMYRITPVFENNNLLATGVRMEAFSVEDQGAGVCFCVFVYNIQPNVEIDYVTGESKIIEN